MMVSGLNAISPREVAAMDVIEDDRVDRLDRLDTLGRRYMMLKMQQQQIVALLSMLSCSWRIAHACL
jgi:hypothetical protein